MPTAMLASVARLVATDDGRVLLAADIEELGEQWLAQGGRELGEQWLAQGGRELGADVLVVPHHGSKSSSSVEFIAAVDPLVAVVPVGGNAFGHPAEEVLARYSGVSLYRTDEDGGVVVTSDGDRLWVRGRGRGVKALMGLFQHRESPRLRLSRATGVASGGLQGVGPVCASRIIENREFVAFRTMGELASRRDHPRMHAHPPSGYDSGEIGAKPPLRQRGPLLTSIAPRVLLAADAVSPEVKAIVRLLADNNLIEIVYEDDLAQLVKLIRAELPFDVLLASATQNPFDQYLGDAAPKTLVVAKRGNREQMDTDDLRSIGGIIIEPLGPGELSTAIRQVADGETVRADPLLESAQRQREAGPSVSVEQLIEFKSSIDSAYAALGQSLDTFFDSTSEDDEDADLRVVIALIEDIALPTLNAASEHLGWLQSRAGVSGTPSIGAIARTQGRLDSIAGTMRLVTEKAREKAPAYMVRVLENAALSVAINVAKGAIG